MGPRRSQKIYVQVLESLLILIKHEQYVSYVVIVVEFCGNTSVGTNPSGMSGFIMDQNVLVK